MHHVVPVAFEEVQGGERLVHPLLSAERSGERTLERARQLIESLQALGRDLEIAASPVKPVVAIRLHREGKAAEDPITGAVLLPPAGRDVDEETGWLLDHFSRAELALLGSAGPRALARRIAIWCGLCVAVALAAGTAVFFTVTDLSADPGLPAVFEVVTAGFALAFSAYHAIRLRTALKLRRDPVDPTLIRLHLEALA